MEDIVRKTLKELRKIDRQDELDALPLLDAVFVDRPGKMQMLTEGKLVSGRFPKNIRIDQSTHTHGVGMTHGHVHGRKGDEYVVVNLDGTGSHGTKGRLHPKDADALRAQGFTIRDDLIVEWIETGFLWTALFEAV